LTKPNRLGERRRTCVPRRTYVLRKRRGASGINFVKFVLRTTSREGEV
jgi:hypothetical protein